MEHLVTFTVNLHVFLFKNLLGDSCKFVVRCFNGFWDGKLCGLSDFNVKAELKLKKLH